MIIIDYNKKIGIIKYLRKEDAMSKYKTMLQETFRTYDNPLSEEISKLILSYLKFYDYIPELGIIRYDDRSYLISFLSKTNKATLHFGENLAVLIEYDGFTETSPLVRMDFIKEERLEYLGDLSDRSIVKTIDKYSKSLFYGPNNYHGLRRDDYLNNRIPASSEPEDFRDFSEYNKPMMRIVASADYANEIRAKRFNPPAFFGRQF